MPALPDVFKEEGEIRGIWLYTWARLEHLRWNDAGLTARITSDRDQILTLRIRQPGALFEIDGITMFMEWDHVEVPFYKGETREISVTF